MRSIRIVPAILFTAMLCVGPAFAAKSPAPSGCHAVKAKGVVRKSAPIDPAGSVAATTEPSAARACFNQLADSALLAMRKQAEELKVKGVAVVAYFDGEKVESWSSKMAVVGRLTDEPGGTQKSSNLLAVAYAKAAEMADTLKNSGSKVRPPMTGEVGWEGGVIVRTTTGYLIAAFSGGQSADDVAISHSGVTQILDQLNAAH